MRRIAVAALLWVSATLFAQSFTIEDDRAVDVAAGEGQSTVVAPGHPDCPAGRVLVSTDFVVGRTGTVAYRDLDKTSTNVSVFAPLPDAHNYEFGTSDHDLVSLSNGDVYYLTGAFSRTPLASQPSWWSSAYRYDFGPGARSNLLVWRSKDCGKTFEYMKDLEFDPARMGDGSCAMPQGNVVHRHSQTGSPKYLVPFQSLGQPGDERFRWCWKCKQLFLSDPSQANVCPFGTHEPGGGIYKVTTQDVAGHANATQFKACNACGTLHRANAPYLACAGQRTHDGAGSPSYFLPWGDAAIAASDKIQEGWRWCNRCQALFHEAKDSLCPLGGRHDLEASAKYQLPLAAFNAPGETDWTRCKKCDGVYRNGAPENVCPNGGDHEDSGVGMKMLVSAPPNVAGQSEWKRCRHCGLLFFGSNESNSRCPLTRPHDGAGSADYRLALENASSPGQLQKDWRVCLKCGSVYFAGAGHAGGGCPVGAAYETPIFDMGGSDGQLVKVDPQLDRMILTFQCVGRTQDKSFAKFQLSNTPVNKTLVAISEKGAPWKLAGTLDRTAWRLGVVPFDAMTFSVGFGDFLVRANASATGLWTFETLVKQAAPGAWGWEGVDAAKPPYTTIDANIWAHTIVTRTPGTSNATLIMPDTIPGKGHGYRIFFHDRATNTYTEAEDAIFPETKNPNDVAFHLQAIHLGVAGPSLLYWYDFNSIAKTITIRGRFILGHGKTTSSFPISQTNKAARSFPATSDMWYGDYQTADGYIKSATAFVFHPMWVEAPGNKVRFGTVVFNPFGIAKQGMVLAKLKPSTLALPAVPLAKITRASQEEKSEREYRPRPPRR